MKHYTLLIAGCLLSLSCLANSSIVSNISAAYRNGQIFIVWTNIPAADTGFYYVYKSKKKITSSNLKNATYIGRVMYNFGYDDRFTKSSLDGTPRYLVINDNPRTVLTPTQNVFVYTETKAHDTSFFAVVSGWGSSTLNSHIAADSNATSSKVIGKLDPVKCYLDEDSVAFDGAKQNETMDVYIHYGGNNSNSNYPAMANEGCLAFHWGITKEGSGALGVAAYLKFHGGGGNFISEQITAIMGFTWKISFDDWIPAYKIDANNGDNTKWFGYSQYVDIYKINNNSAPPTNGIIKAYTFNRIDWEYEWILKNWPGSVDTSRVYLVGDSEGTGAVMIHSQVEPNRWAAGTFTNPKFNLNAPQDYNPACKYNTGNSGRTSLNIYWGDHLLNNLQTDVPVKAGSNKFYRIYNITDGNYMLKINKGNALPFLGAISGKNDNTTCWQEKPSYYDSVNYYDAGGEYFWDMRQHGGNGYNEWSPISLIDLQYRYFLDRSYPAVSNCTINGNPGESNVMTPPYYDGDSVGTIQGNVDWVDNSILDSSLEWSIQMFIFQRTCSSGLVIPGVLPTYANATITLRRLQNFVNIPNGTKLCWAVTNKGAVVQTGTFTTAKAPITLKNVRIYADTSTFTIGYCSDPKNQFMLSAENKNAQIEVFPNPCAEKFISITIPDELEPSAKILVYDAIGHLVLQSDIGQLFPNAKTFTINLTNLNSGIYYVNLLQNQTTNTFSFIKSN